MNLSNDDQMFTILSKGAPELLEVYQAMKANDVDAKTLVEVSENIGQVAKSKVPSSVNIHIENKKVIGVSCKAVASDWDDTIKEAIAKSGVSEDILVKGLFLLANVRNISKWGKVTFLVQEGETVRVQQEQGFKVD